MRSAYLKNYSPRIRHIPLNRRHEESDQLWACTYLRQHFPDAIFRSDYASGLGLTMYQATIHKRLQSSRSWPDLFIYAPRRGFYGLAIELKKEGTTIIVSRGPQKGKLTANEHIREQFFMLKELKKRGYYATFACGREEFIKTVNWYFGRIERENESLF
jgi:hypothetical protein